MSNHSFIIKDMGNYSRLGNQMFQYAVGWLAAMKKNCRLVLPQHRFDSGEITLLKTFDQIYYDTHVLTPIVGTVKEPKEFVFMPELLSPSELPGSVILEGYFQNNDYFKNQEQIVSNLFTFRSEVLQEAKAFLEPYQNKSIVSVHIRLKDNIYDPSEFIYTIWSPDTLDKVMQECYAKDPNTHFVIHSSNLIECQRVFSDMLSGYSHTFANLSESVALAAMSMCDRHIISASTFSWWGAWFSHQRLEGNAEVHIPNVWFNPKVDRLKDTYVEGLYLTGWKRQPIC